jgi:hypothetical protein
MLSDRPQEQALNASAALGQTASLPTSWQICWTTETLLNAKDVDQNMYNGI